MFEGDYFRFFSAFCAASRSVAFAIGSITRSEELAAWFKLELQLAGKAVTPPLTIEKSGRYGAI